MQGFRFPKLPLKEHFMLQIKVKDFVLISFVGYLDISGFWLFNLWLHENMGTSKVQCSPIHTRKWTFDPLKKWTSSIAKLKFNNVIRGYVLNYDGLLHTFANRHNLKKKNQIKFTTLSSSLIWNVTNYWKPL